MREQSTSENCKKCHQELIGDYCSNCGFPKQLRRIDKRYVFQEIGSVLNFDKGIFYTIKELLIRPGKTVQQFILEDRNRLVKPIVFIIICSLIYSIAQQIFHFEDGYVGHSLEERTTAASMFQWVSKNYGYSNIIMGILIAFWIKVFFKKYGYNFYEILILLCFVMGIGMLLFALFGIADSLTDLKIIDKGFLIGILYILWSIGQFFNKKKFFNYLKAMFAYFLGMLTFTIGIILVGSIIDFIF